MTNLMTARDQGPFGEVSGFLRRVGLVTATALVAMAIVLAASASWDPSLGRENLPDAVPSPAGIVDVV